MLLTLRMSLPQKFVTSYKENYGETPIQFAADAYDAIYAIKAAMEEADITTGYICKRYLR